MARTVALQFRHRELLSSICSDRKGTRSLKVGDIVKLQHGNAKVVFVDKKEVLLDCDNTDDGEFYMSAKAGYVPKRHGRRLKWMKKKDLM